MDLWTDCPGYESFPNFDDPTPFGSSSTYMNNNNNLSFTTISRPLFNIDPNTMSHDNMSHCPTTPSPARTSGLTPYTIMKNNLVTPYGQQSSRSTDYQYADPDMSMQQTPIPPQMYGCHTSTMYAPVPATSAVDFVSYNPKHQSFSDTGGNFAGVSTPASKQGSIPTPSSSPQSSQSTEQDLPSVPLSQLQYNNFEEAEAETSGRTPLRIYNDDWKYVVANKTFYVATIMAAFEAPFRPEPNVALTITEKLRWVKYQTEQSDKVAKYLAKNPKSKELSAWLLLEALLDVHKLGYKRGFRIADPNMRCSARFDRMVRAIRNYAVIRFDLVRMQRLDDLATSPSHAVSRKVANWRGNSGKVKRDEANQREAAAHGVEYKNVLGDKRKYKPLLPEPVEEDDEGNEDMSGFDSPFDKQQGTKRKANDGGGGGDDGGGDGGGDGEFTPSATPSKGTRKTAGVVNNKRAKHVIVVAGADADI